jgi:hypothetical protein
MWPIEKSLTKRDGPQAPTSIHGLLGLLFHTIEKANAIADCLEHQFMPHALCDKNHKWRMEARIQALLADENSNPPEKIRPCDLQKLINILTLKKTSGINGITNESLKHLPRRPLVHLTHLINHCIRLSYFPHLGRKQKR